MAQTANKRMTEAVTIYSPMFKDPGIPRHIYLDQHTTALLIREWLANALTDGTATEMGPK